MKDEPIRLIGPSLSSNSSIRQHEELDLAARFPDPFVLLYLAYWFCLLKSPFSVMLSQLVYYSYALMIISVSH